MDGSGVMFGRSSARGGASQEDAVGDYDDYDADTAGPTANSAPRGRRLRPGSGGRWWVGLGRAVLWAFLIVVIINGIWLPFRDGFAPPSQDDETEDSGPQFPTTAGSAFAVRFGNAYLNVDGGAADERERAEEIAQFVPEGEEDAFDNASGALTGENLQVATVDVEDDQNAVITLSVDINGEPMSLDVPVYADENAAMVVSGPPALLAAPTTAELPNGDSVENDTDVRDALEPNLEGFFEAYADNPEHLQSYVESGAGVAELPPNTVTFQELDEVVVPVGSGNGGDEREATATVVWQLAGDEAQADNAESPTDMRQTYQLTVVKDGDAWKVRDIQGAPQSFTE